VNKDLNAWAIPIDDLKIANVKRGISLRTEPNKNG